MSVHDEVLPGSMSEAHGFLCYFSLRLAKPFGERIRKCTSAVCVVGPTSVQPLPTLRRHFDNLLLYLSILHVDCSAHASVDMISQNEGADALKYAHRGDVFVFADIVHTQIGRAIMA